jgi:hypothetical protein
VPYRPEAIAAAIRNASAHLAFRWRILPLWVLKISEENPIVPRLYLAAFAGVAIITIVWKIIERLLPHPAGTTVP